MKRTGWLLAYGTYTACAFEAFAGFTRRAPTISRLVGVQPFVGGMILGALSAHFYMVRRDHLRSQVAQ